MQSRSSGAIAQWRGAGMVNLKVSWIVIAFIGKQRDAIAQ